MAEREVTVWRQLGSRVLNSLTSSFFPPYSVLELLLHVGNYGVRGSSTWSLTGKRERRCLTTAVAYVHLTKAEEYSGIRTTQSRMGCHFAMTSAAAGMETVL